MSYVQESQDASQLACARCGGNNITDFVDDELNEKTVVKRGRDQKWTKYRDEKFPYNNTVLDLFLHDEEGFRRFRCMNYEHFIGLTEMISLIVSKIDQC